jgi:ferredoxin
MKTRKKVVLSFPPSLVEEPVTYHLVKDYELMINILRARVDPGKKGRLVLELMGDQNQISRGLNYLERIGVTLEPLTDEIQHLQARCTHCTACVPICPTGALDVDRTTMLVVFDSEKCVLCGSCVSVCPYRAMEMYPQ